MSELGKHLKELRGNKSLREVQQGSGVSHSYLSTLENGYDPRSKKERKPNPVILKKLADYYKADYSEIMEKSGY